MARKGEAYARFTRNFDAIGWNGAGEVRARSSASVESLCLASRRDRMRVAQHIQCWEAGANPSTSPVGTAEGAVRLLQPPLRTGESSPAFPALDVLGYPHPVP